MIKRFRKVQGFICDIESESDKLLDLSEIEDMLNKQDKLINLIADVCSYTKEHSVKELLRNEIKGIDSVTDESFEARKEYNLLNNFFKKHYMEDWDNE